MKIKDIQKALKKYQPKMDQDYQQKLQIAKYTNLSDIEKSNFIQNSGIFNLDLGFEQQNVCFLFNGNIQNSFDNNKLIYYTINSLDNKIDQNTYTIVYIMSEHDGLSQLIRFRKLMKQLSSKYYIQLKCFYLYQPSFKIKANLLIQRSRSKREKILYKKTKYIYEVKELLQIPNFQASWMITVPKQIQSFEQIEPVQSIKQSQSSFGSSLSSQKLNQFQIPLVIDHLLSYFVVNPDRFLIPDIFRKQGLITEEDQLQQQLINENYECLKIVEDVRIICSLIKRFFLELPDPLIPEHIFKRICDHFEQTTAQTEIDLLKEVFDQLPNLNKSLLIVMVSFLICVGNHSEFNRMNMNNLAILFAPCFMRVQVNQTQSIEQIKHQLKFLKILFDNYDKLFPNVSFKLFLEYGQAQVFSSISSNSSTGADTSGNKNQRLSSSDDDVLPEFQQKQKLWVLQQIMQYINLFKFKFISMFSNQKINLIKNQKSLGHTRTRTWVTGFKVQGANHYTIRPKLISKTKQYLQQV